MKIPSLVALLVITLSLFASAQEPMKLSFQNSDVREVLAFYEKLTGNHLVLDSQVVGPVSVTTLTPVPTSKAIELIESTLFTNGYSLIQIRPDTIQVVGIGKNVRAEAVPVITKPEELPVGERVVTYIYKLKSRDPGEICQILSIYCVPASTGATSLLPDVSTRSIIITEQTSLLRSLIKLLGELDQPKPQ